VPERKHRHRHHHRNGLESYHYGDEHQPIVTERHARIEGEDYGHDMYGDEYHYEHYQLKQPHLPRVPIPFERPAHPLDHQYLPERYRD